MLRSAPCLTSLIVLALTRGVSAEEPARPPAPKESTPLYDGKDLSGWEVYDGKLDAWKADGDLLTCVAPGGGWLRTARTYSDFVLNLEYRIPPGGNSGIGVRLPETGAPHHAGMEIQILDDEAPEHRNLDEAQYTGSVYYQAAAKRGAAKPPGEWNACEITCRGPQVKVVLNDETVVDIQVDEHVEGRGNQTPLSERPETGRIGLQSHGTRVDFRNIRVRDLDTTTNSGLRYLDLATGTGAVVPSGSSVAVRYTGRLADGKRFDPTRDRSKTVPLSLKETIKGWAEGIPGMKVGGRRKLIVPPELGYGERGAGGIIPPGATLVFDVEVVDLE